MNTTNINKICEEGKLDELIKLQKEGYIFRYDNDTMLN